MEPFLALITPVGGTSTPPPTGGPPGIWHPTWPTNPIVVPPGYGRPPLGIWGGGGVGNYPDAGFPGPQPGGPVYPSHPIYYPPTGIWGGGGVGNYPDAGFPGPQPGGPIGIWGGGGVGNYPDAGFPGPQPPKPVYPSHPIWYPNLGFWGGSLGPYPDAGFPGPQPPPGTQPPRPGAPPVGVNLPTQDPSGSGWVYAYVPGYGWMWAQVPQQPAPPTDPNAGPPGTGPSHPIQPTGPEPKE